MDTVNVSNIISVINKKYKKNIVFKGDELAKHEFIPFTSARMNYILRGGIPKGKMVEFVGKESSGKTTSALDILANFQKTDQRYTVYLDAENTLNKTWGEQLGVNWEKVILIQPQEEHGELLLDMVLDLVKTDNVGLVIIDSVPFLVPLSAWDTSLEQRTYGGNSILMTNFCSKIIPLMNKHSCTVLLINQVRDKIGVTYTAYSYPGGRMLYHSCSTVLHFSKGSLLDEAGKEVSNSYETPYGHLVQVKVEKNKVTKNDRRLGYYTLNYYTGIDWISDLVDVALIMGYINQAGSWFMLSYKEEEIKFQGKSKLVEYCKENADILDYLNTEIQNKLEQGE